MAAVVLCWTLLTVGFLGSASEAPDLEESGLAANDTQVRENIIAHSGEKVTLQCQSPVDEDFKVLEWSRSDHEELIYVFLYRDGQFDPENQHPSFENRVELKDKQMKNGDMSLILRNVTINDTGTYECRVNQKSSRTVLGTDPIKVINLEVNNNVRENITAHSGDKVTLQCQSPVDKDFKVLEWSRSDHEELVYVFLYRDGKFDPENQHPSFENRVELKDKQMKNGDMSLILRNVTINDTGTYECRVNQKASRTALGTDPIKVINLEVNNNGQDLGPKVWQNITEVRENITAHSGDKVTLQCQSPVDEDFKVLEWSRSDHEELIYVFLYRDGQFDPENQHPSFKDRVELKDKQMKNGDMSLILSSVTINDTGTYECRIDQRASTTFQHTNLIKVINLEVTNNDQVLEPKVWQNLTGGQRDGNVLEYVGLILYQILFLIILWR